MSKRLPCGIDAIDCGACRDFVKKAIAAARAAGRREGLEVAIRACEPALGYYGTGEAVRAIRALLAQSPPKEPRYQCAMCGDYVVTNDLATPCPRCEVPARDMAERIVGRLRELANGYGPGYITGHAAADQIAREFLPAEKGHDNG